MVKEEKKKASYFFKKPLRVAFFSGIALIAISIIAYFLAFIFGLVNSGQEISQGNFIFYLDQVQSILESIAIMLFLYGFYVLGAKYSSKILKVASVSLIIIFILGLLLSLFYASALIEFSSSIQENTARLESLEASGDSIQIMQELMKIFKPVIPYFISLLLLGLLLFIFYLILGIGFIKLKDKISMAGVCGHLIVWSLTALIISLPLLLIIIGIIPLIISLMGLLASYVFLLIILFKESEKLKL